MSSNPEERGEASVLPTEASALGSARKPRGSLRRRIALWAVVLVALPTVLCAVWLNRITTRSMSRSHVQTVRLLGRTLSGALAGRIDQGWNDASQAVTDAAIGDPRVAMIVVTNAQDQLLHRRVTDPQVYQRLLAAGLNERSFDVDVGRPRLLGDHDELVVQKLPIWDVPRKSQSALASPASTGAIERGANDPGSILNEAVRAISSSMAFGDLSISKVPADRDLEGFVLLAVHDPQLPSVLAELQKTQFLAAGLVCLAVVPLLLFLAHRWTRPVRAMLGATSQLAAGKPTSQVPAHDRDELGLLGRAFNDMADRLTQARQQLIEHNEHLEDEVNQRTAELAQANDALAQQIEEKDVLMRAVSHDLGAPLRNIDGMATMVLHKHRQELADDAVVKLERISSNVKAQTQLIGELVRDARHTPSRTDNGANQPRHGDFSRRDPNSSPERQPPNPDQGTTRPQRLTRSQKPESANVDHVPRTDSQSSQEQSPDSAHDQSATLAGQTVVSETELDPAASEAIDVRRVVEQIGEALSYELESGQIELRIEGAFPELHVDPIRIRQVFQNLIDNAAKYMADHAVRRITVRAEAWPEENAYCFHVSDTGGGIAAEDMPSLFNAYNRGQWGESEVAGTGVGLASIKAIIEGYGGKIWARSQPGRGSTFSFTLAP